MTTLFWIVALGFILFFLVMRMPKAFAGSVGAYAGLWAGTQLHLDWRLSIILGIGLYFLIGLLYEGKTRRS